MSFSSRLALAAATVTAAAATVAAGPPETGFYCPGGIYSNVPTRDAAACAIACAQDRICMAWTFRATEFVGCSLKAVVPASVPDHLAVSGIADRATDFLSLVSNAPPPAPAAPVPAPSVEASPPAPAANLAAAPPEPKAPAQTAAAPEIKDAAPELLGAPAAALSEAAGVIAPATLQPVRFARDLGPSPRPILELAPPQALQTTARLTAPVTRPTVQQPVAAFEIAALVLPPEPEPLAAPMTVTARLPGVTRIASRAPTALAAPAAMFVVSVIVEEPAEPLAAPAMLTARLSGVSPVAYRAPPVLVALAPALTPILAIEPPATLQKAVLVTAAATPRALQTARSGLNDHVVLALPPAASAEPPRPVQSAAFAAIDPAMLTKTSAEAPAEEELLGAP